MCLWIITAIWRSSMAVQLDIESHLYHNTLFMNFFTNNAYAHRGHNKKSNPQLWNSWTYAYTNKVAVSGTSKTVKNHHTIFIVLWFMPIIEELYCNNNVCNLIYFHCCSISQIYSIFKISKICGRLLDCHLNCTKCVIIYYLP